MQTNLYEPLAQLIEAYKIDVARRTAEIALANQSPLLKGMTIEQIVERLSKSIEMVIRYLRSGDASEWSNYIAKVSAEWRNQGYNTEQVNTVGTTIAEKMIEIVEENLPGEAHQIERDRYIRRIKGLNSLAGISSLNAQLKKEILNDS
jgi:hypothetical protein